MIAYRLANYVMRLIHFQWWKLSNSKKRCTVKEECTAPFFSVMALFYALAVLAPKWPLVVVQCMAVMRHRSSGAFRNWHSLHVILLRDIGLSYLLCARVYIMHNHAFHGATNFILCTRVTRPFQVLREGLASETTQNHLPTPLYIPPCYDTGFWPHYGT